MSDTKAYYETLGVRPDASQREIKEAYRRLGWQHHPDRNDNSEESTELFKRINEAYDVLSDTKKRRRYDYGAQPESGETWHQTGQSGDPLTDLKFYAQRFYEENWDLFSSEFNHLIRILNAGYDPPIEFSTEILFSNSIRGMTTAFPILRAEKKGRNVVVTNIGGDLLGSFLGVELRKPVAATLMYPISKLFRGDDYVPKSLHQITNFEKEHHNRTPIKNFGVGYRGPLEAALVIRYLNEVSELPADEIFDLVLDRTHRGKLDHVINDGAAPYIMEKLAHILGLKLTEDYRFGFEFNVTNAPGIFKRLNIQSLDSDIGGSSIYMELNDIPLPAIPVPYRHILIPTTQLQRTFGLANAVPLSSFTLFDRKDHLYERIQMDTEFLVAAQYSKHAPWGNMDWVINTPNILDTALTAFLLVHVLIPTMNHFSSESRDHQKNTLKSPDLEYRLLT